MNNKLNQKKTFSISYDMEETSDHSIDAEVLGQSLLSLAKVIRQSDKILNGENSEVKVEVKAHKEGSFTVDLVTWYQAGGADVLSALGFSAAGFAAASGTAFGIIKQIKSKKIKAKITKGQTSKLVLNDDTTVECPTPIAKLVSDKYLRQELANVMNTPIANKEGAKFVIKGDNNEVLDSLESDDAFSFKSLPQKTLEEVEENIEQQTITFSQVNFDGPTGWRCDLPNGKNVSIRMRHEAFRNRINQGYETFAKGEPYIVQLREKTVTKPNQEPNTTYYIEEVIRQVGTKKRG
ncbi:hypothetical protein FXE96_13955 [Vibrio cholerae]|uniref:hypothetical protein n=1 Tax=Vibrio cholerae TaxID=666 RepID=UPI0011DBE88E|nr:hypothetical protein [Vibrio cholerae]EGR4341697.1 hypothetical protein [Vibrio cholerae]TXX75638.1 hypothetical protein FXE96_13955 [Vibrio cholerae]GIA23896.1 hypothetical protein VCSRO130_0443 [Vibrio cholerae]